MYGQLTELMLPGGNLTSALQRYDLHLTQRLYYPLFIFNLINSGTKSSILVVQDSITASLTNSGGII